MVAPSRLPLFISVDVLRADKDPPNLVLALRSAHPFSKLHINMIGRSL